jgi:hypothetical protein
MSKIISHQNQIVEKALIQQVEVDQEIKRMCSPDQRQSSVISALSPVRLYSLAKGSSGGTERERGKSLERNMRGDGIIDSEEERASAITGIISC